MKNGKPFILRQVVLSLGFILLTLVLTAQQSVNAASAETVRHSPYTSPIFYALCFLAIILLVFILQLSKVLSTVARNYKRGDKSLWDNVGMIILLLSIGILLPEQLSAAAPVVAPIPDAHPVLDFLHDGFGTNAINSLALIIFIELLVVIYLMRLVRMFTLKEQDYESALSEKTAPATSPLWDKLNASVAIAEEKAIMTDHEYDGIRELDNSLPPWWKYGFYLTIVWAFGYMLYYHISSGPSSEQEYKAQMKQAEIDIAEYLKNAKNLVDETNVTVSSEASDLNSGKAIFGQYCAVCHAADGGGIVGPNLTDNYWLHGNDIKNIFNTIKYGVQGKGMKSWQQELSPVMMAQVASFITTLAGTTPAAPKAPEGKPIERPAAVTAADSITSDTLKK
jgi:cytochrome c oxidase cbb3-type subunit 3